MSTLPRALVLLFRHSSYRLRSSSSRVCKWKGRDLITVRAEGP